MINMITFRIAYSLTFSSSFPYIFFHLEEVRSKLIEVAGVAKPEDWTTCIVQGSGTFGVEATITSTIPRNGMYHSNSSFLFLRIPTSLKMHPFHTFNLFLSPI